MSLPVSARCALVAALLLPSAMPAQRAQPWGLYSVRYDTRTSNFIYALYGYGSAFAMVGVLQNPRSGYNEQLAAMGRTFSVRGSPAQSAAVGVARASDGWYAQLYYLPAVHRGPIWVNATTEWYFPLDRGGTVQFDVSPLSVTADATRLVRLGVAVDFAAAETSRPGTALGPALRLTLPKATMGLDAQRAVDENASRMRVSFTTSF